MQVRDFKFILPHSILRLNRRLKSELKLFFSRKYGQKKSWHLVGFVCVMISFPFIFLPCMGCSLSDEWAQLIYYSAFAIIFQFGWASMQVNSDKIKSLVFDSEPIYFVAHEKYLRPLHCFVKNNTDQH